MPVVAWTDKAATPPRGHARHARPKPNGNVSVRHPTGLTVVETRAKKSKTAPKDAAMVCAKATAKAAAMGPVNQA
jgi:hypothetical protein